MISEGPRPRYLRTKLLPPRPALAFLPRPRLVARLAENIAQPLTLVTANAGSGKTTLVADFVRQHAPRHVWYQLDRTDGDPAVFLGYIATGIRSIFETFGDATLDYVRESASEVANQPERATDVLINEILDAVDERLVLVLDDYHHLGASAPVHRVVERLLAYLPETVHTIIASREMPPLAVSRLRTHDKVVVVGRRDLLFTDDEVAELFGTVFNIEMSPSQLVTFRERTHGWITALQLVRQVAKRANGPETPVDLLPALEQSEHDIFEYFAEEVFADEAPEVQELLVRSSLLERADVATCAALFGDLDPVATYSSLVRRHVFVSIAGEGDAAEIRLHPLFRDFLRRRFLSTYGPDGVSAEHERIARHLLAVGRDDIAARHLVAAGRFDDAAGVVATRAEAWIGAGLFNQLVSLCAEIPEAALERAPRSLLHRAEVARLQGDLDGAEALLNRAARALEGAGDAEGHAEALHSLAAIARRTGDIAGAFDLLDRASAIAPPDAPVHVRCANTRGLCLVARCEWAAAEREFRTGLESARLRGERHVARLLAHNIGLPAMVRGDFGEALKWLGRLTSETSRPAPQAATAHLNSGRCLIYRGAFDEASRHLDRALEIAQLFNLGALRGEIFEAFGNLARERGEAARAEEFYVRAGRAYEECGVDVTTRELLDERATLLLQRGDLAGARTLAERLAAARAEAGDEMGRRAAGLTLGRILAASGEAAAARRELEAATVFFRTASYYYYEANGSMALAALDAAEGHHAGMLGRLERAVALALRFDYEYWLDREACAAPHLFGSEDAADLLPPDVRARAAAALASAPRVAVDGVVVPVAPVDLTINLLGPLEIVRDPERPLAADAWTTRRARDILCFLATRPHRRAAKELIIDTFWGESELDIVEKNFHPTISHVRKALNSNQPLKQNFILFRGGEYILNPGFVYSIDTERFVDAVREGTAAAALGESEKCRSALDRAVALYRGEFMQGDYEPWVDELRGFFEEQYLRALELLATDAAGRGDWQRSLEIAGAILKVDPFREDVHRVTMRAHAALGNRGAVRDQFESLSRILREELDVEPEPATKRVFEELMR